MPTEQCSAATERLQGMTIFQFLAADRRIRFLAQITSAPYRPITPSSTDKRSAS